MASRRQAVWLITGAASSFGYRLCITALARGDFVIASASSQHDVDRLRSSGAYGIKLDTEMTFGQIKGKIREAVAYYGRVDFLVNNPDFEFRMPQNAYHTNAFSYAAIQITKAVVQESAIRQITVIAHGGEASQSQQAVYDMSDNVEGTARLFASEYGSRGVRVLLVHPRCIVPTSGSQYAPGDIRGIVERFVRKVVEGGASESGIRVL